MANATTLLEVHQGQSSFYHATGAGACGFEATPKDLMVAAINVHDYAEGALCGVYLRISGPRGEALVRVVDRCTGCKSGGLDLSKQAFAKVADLKKGRDTLRWQIASPDLDGTLQYHFKAGSSPHWLGIQLRNHRNPISMLEYRSADGQWHDIPRSAHNYFVNKNPAIGAGPYTFRVTDIYGNQVVDNNIPLRPGTQVASATQLPDFAEAAHLASTGGRWMSEDEANNMAEPAPGAGRWQSAANAPQSQHPGRWLSEDEADNMAEPDSAAGRWKPVAEKPTATAEQVASRWQQEGNTHVAAPAKPARQAARRKQPSHEEDMVPEAARWLAETPAEAPAAETAEMDDGPARWANPATLDGSPPAVANQTSDNNSPADKPTAVPDKEARAPATLDDLLAHKAVH